MFFFSRHIFYYSRILKYTLVYIYYSTTVLLLIQCLGGRDTILQSILLVIKNQYTYIHSQYTILYRILSLSLSVFFTKGPSSCVLKIQKACTSMEQKSGLVPAFTSFLAKGGREPTRPPTYIQPFETFFLAFTGLSEYTASTLQNSLFSFFILCYIYTPQKRIRNEKNDKKPTVWSSA